VHPFYSSVIPRPLPHPKPAFNQPALLSLLSILAIFSRASELDTEAEGEGDEEGEEGLLIVIAGIGIAGTCLAITTSLPSSCVPTPTSLSLVSTWSLFCA